jgi:hypothetical protein
MKEEKPELDKLIEKIIFNKQKLADLRSKSKNLEEYQKAELQSVEGFLAYLEKMFKHIKEAEK